MRLVASLIALAGLAAPAPPVLGEDARFSLCAELPYRTCVHNGDLIYLRGESIRLADIVTPDRYASACPQASNTAWYAAIRLRDLLNEGDFELIEDPPGADGERMAQLWRDGASLGDVLLNAGLAERRTAQPPDWCD